MQTISGVLQTMLICGTLLGIASLVLLSLPQSELRAFLLPIVGWGIAIFCGLWCISPVDPIPDIFFPFGFTDDIAALAIGVTSARMAMTSGQRKTTKQEA